MARGTAVREFVQQLRTRFYEQLDITDKDNETEYFGYTIQHAFERAVNDVLMGKSPEAPAPKPRKKRTRKTNSEATQQPEV